MIRTNKNLKFFSTKAFLVSSSTCYLPAEKNFLLIDPILVMFLLSSFTFEFDVPQRKKNHILGQAHPNPESSEVLCVLCGTC